MKFVIALLLIQFTATPWVMISSMLKKTAIPDSKVSISGETEDGTALNLSYSFASDTMTITKGSDKNSYFGNEIPLWTRVFFPPKGDKKTDALVKVLKESGIETGKKMLSLTKRGGEVVFVIGRDSEDDSSPALMIDRENSLPRKIIYNGNEVSFSEYHKSPYPLAFPGKIEIKSGEKNELYIFFRKEFKVDY